MPHTNVQKSVMHVQSRCFDCHSLDVAVVVAFKKLPIYPGAKDEDKVERQALEGVPSPGLTVELFPLGR